MATAPRTSLRPMLTRLHFYVGLLVGPFILVAALSGALYAASPTLEQVLHEDVLTTQERGPATPVAEQVAAARAVQPDLPLLAVRPAAEQGQTTRVLFDDGRTEQSRRLAVFVDPATAQVAGQLTAYGSSGSLPVRTWIDELHRFLHLGEPGRLYSELAASWLWIGVLAGLALWWTGPRRRRRLRPDRTGSPRRRRLSWHGVVGTWLALGFLMLSATGLTWSTYAGATATELRQALSWTTPAVMTDLEGGVADEHAGHVEGGQDADAGATHTDHEGMTGGHTSTADDPGVGIDVALAAAAEQGLRAPVEVGLPVGDSGTWTVAELEKSWPTQADVVAVAPSTGEVVDVVRFADHPFMAKMARWGIDLHMGLLFGVWNQVALVALGLGLATMVLWGYRMWWSRRPRAGEGLPAAPPAGSWRRVDPRALVPLLVLTAVIGWALPLVGVSLVVFLVLDLLGGLVRRHRAGAGGTVMTVTRWTGRARARAPDRTGRA